ncbi:MAG TPA: TonB-dependent receptor [Dongiaceae bacterium]|nr:TonB-dependent receptor [Dongiaceae bacterium]
MNNSERQGKRVLGRRVVLGFACLSAMVLSLLGFAVAPASAQKTTGTLRGQVLDPQDAAVPDAEVTITNQETGVSVKVITTSAGTYTLPSVLPGLYRVSIEAKGFRGFVRHDITVLANQDNVADAKLELGTAADTIEVSAGAVQVQTSSSALDNTYDARDVQLPNAAGTLNGSPINLAVLAPNVIATPGGTQGVGGSVGGTRPRDNNFSVDGVDDNNLGVTGNNSTVIPDAVAEFNLTTNQFSAEYGHSAGGQFSLVTKTGTNNWHGSGEWYNQNRNYNALDNLTAAAIDAGTIPGKPAFDNNRFGGTVGGPIIKNKLFIFGAYEYTTLHGDGAPAPLVQPTADGLASLKAMAADQQVLDILQNFPVAPVGDLPSTVVNGTTIPLGNLIITSPLYQREHDAQVNADYTWNKHQIGARFLFNQANFIIPVNSTIAQFNQNSPLHNRKIALTDAWTINSTMLNDLRVQYSFFYNGFFNPCSSCPPDVTIPELNSNTIGPADNQYQKQNTYQIADTFSWSKGKHSFKFGAQYNHFIYPQFFLSRSNGDYWYSDLQEFINDELPSQSGRTLRGAGTGSFLGTQSAFYFFAQDDFKISPRLTVNLGVRYEYWTNPVGSETQALNAISSVPGVINFGVPKTDKNNIAPRIGFAYDPFGNGKTSIRGGFGIAYDVKFQNFASITLPPQLQSELNPDSACTLTPQPGWCTTQNGAGFLALGGLPATYIPPANQADARALTTAYIDDTVMPKILTWSLGVQHELYRNTTLEVRYLGTRGLSLPVQFRRNFESYFDGGGTPLPTFLDPSQIPATWNAATPTDTAFYTFNPNTYAQYGFQGNVTGDPPLGSSTYHAASVNFTQRGMHGLTFNANYTYSHTLDDATNEFFTSLLNPRRAQDTNRIGEDWGNSDLDVRHKFALSLTYDVPKVNSDNKFVKAAVNGFQVSSIFLAQTGQPVTLQSGIDSNGNGDSAGDRVVVNPGGVGLTGSDVFPVCASTTGTSSGVPVGNTYIGSVGIVSNTAPTNGCATNSSAATLGFDPAIGYTPVNPKAKYVVAGPGVRTSAARNSFFSPGFSTWNMGVAKRIYFSESKYLQARMDVFNILNHPSYALSNGNVFNAAGITTATTTQGYALPFDPNFLRASSFFSGGNRSMTLGLKFVF